MATVLHIIAHPNPEHSQTTSIAGALLGRYRELHPEDTIDELALYRESVPYLTATHLAGMMKRAPAQKTPAEQAACDEILRHVDRFRAADKFVVTTPMWNFSVPAILKAYLDIIVQAGLTFRYTEVGAVEGLMAGGRLALVGTRGGIYSVPPLAEVEHCFTYLHHIFDFLGLDIAGTFIAEGLALAAPDEHEHILAPVREQARAFAEKF